MDLLSGEPARALLVDPGFVARWRVLWEDCGSGVFRSPDFVQAAISAEPGAPVVLTESKDQNLLGLWVLAPQGAGVLGPPGGAETLRQGWLASPLDGGFFIERAVMALVRAGLGPEIRLHRLPPGLPLDWARSSREVGRVSRVSTPNAAFVGLDAERAKKPIDDKLHAPQLAAWKALGKVSLELNPSDAVEWIGAAAEWHDQRCHDQGLALRYQAEPRRIDLLRRVAGGPLQVQVLRAGGQVVSVQAFYAYGKEALLALAAERPTLEPIAPGLIHWSLLEPWLLSLGVTEVDVTAGPTWLGLLSTRRAQLESVTIYGRRWDRVRGDAQQALVSLSRWALSRLEG